jgi:acyl-CoA synthetase (NDP forming)
VTGTDLWYLHNPNSVAVVGASDDPDKIGGRPLRYLRDLGFSGTVLPVNPARREVQGLAAYPSVSDLPRVPDVALIAVPGQAAVDAVLACAELGVKGAIVMASGFGETADPEGHRRQDEMLLAARRAGMRLVGPNSQGLANFATGAVLGFSTMFTEQPPHDGPVAIVSQSGGMCAVPYGMLRRRGLGVRYAHGTGNDLDLGVGDLAEAVLADPDIRLLMLYVEDIRDPGPLERAARIGLERGVPIVAMMGGRSAEGRRAAASHTGALANSQRVVDAFFERCGIWRARNLTEFVAATELYLRDWKPRGRRLAVVSNSGAVCVLASDAAVDHGLELSRFSRATTDALTEVLPSFATKANPIDVTAGLLTDSSLFGGVLPVLAADGSVDACLVGIPVAGRGYDIARFASDITAFARGDDKPVVVSTPQPSVAAEFRRAGLAVFDDEDSAIAALAQLLKHHELMGRARTMRPRPAVRGRRAGTERSLSEAAALDVIRQAGVSAVDAVLCASPAEAAEAFDRFGGLPVAVKGAPAAATHKSELGLVRLNVSSAAAVIDAATELFARMAEVGLDAAGVLVARMVRGRTEALVGGHVDPVFGPVVLVGAGGTYVEVDPDVQVLLPPFDAGHARRAISGLRLAPLLVGVRGEPATDVGPWARAAVAIAELMLRDERVLSVDVNPLVLGVPTDDDQSGRPGTGAVAVDAVVVMAT